LSREKCKKGGFVVHALTQKKVFSKIEVFERTCTEALEALEALILLFSEKLDFVEFFRAWMSAGGIEVGRGGG
jgi:hypothetical protein